ncbi:MAG: hypothetical protein QMC80_01115 [Thermoplasmatales archaeon]|nr:hypothetical protein [Thermoplasmatales archaeon]
MKRKYFGKEEIIKRLRGIGKKLPEPVKVYMIGGGAMGLKGRKDVTKDVDIILTNQGAVNVFVKTLKAMGYYEPSSLTKEYDKLWVEAILRDKEYFQFDIFLKRVCNALELSDAMMDRAEKYSRFGKLQLYLLTVEDVFLFKSVTERDKDMEDMLTLLRKGINENIVVEECRNQRIKTGRIWETFLVTKIEEIEAKYKITIPWKKKLIRTGEKETAKYLIIDKIKKEENTAKQIATALGISYNFTKEIIKDLEKNGKITVDRSRKPYKYRISV